MFENQFSVGDYIKVDGQEGYVEATAMRVTYLRTFKGEQIIIPNGNISQVINYTRGGYTAVVSVKVPLYHGCGYCAGGSASGGRACLCGQPRCDRAAKLRGVTAFDQYGFEVTAAAKVKALTQWGCEWAIRREILREFAERGLEIASISGGAAPGQAEVRESEAAAAEPPTEA